MRNACGAESQRSELSRKVWVRVLEFGGLSLDQSSFGGLSSFGRPDRYEMHGCAYKRGTQPTIDTVVILALPSNEILSSPTLIERPTPDVPTP